MMVTATRGDLAAGDRSVGLGPKSTNGKPSVLRRVQQSQFIFFFSRLILHLKSRTFLRPTLPAIIQPRRGNVGETSGAEQYPLQLVHIRACEFDPRRQAVQ